MLVVGTWSFSREAVKIAFDKLKKSRNCVDAVECGINAIESDDKYGPCIVGRGGPRNADGVLEMDAAIMDGQTMQFGAVTGLNGIATPVSVARSVMYESPHSMLTAAGAQKFAKKHGITIDESLQSPTAGQGPQLLEKTGSPHVHDTLGLIALNMEGPRIAVGVSTSGMPGKHSGRVGDSALPGCGLYANDVGASCCSGDGDEILKFCPAFHAVHLMAMGKTPTEACQEVVQTILKRAGKYVEIGMIAVNSKGEFGAATSVDSWIDPLTGAIYKGFPYVIMTSERNQPTITVAEKVT